MTHRTYVVNDCERCGHSANAHRFDDDLLITGVTHLTPGAPFRCVEGDCACPDMVGAAVTWVGEPA